MLRMLTYATKTQKENRLAELPNGEHLWFMDSIVILKDLHLQKMDDARPGRRKEIARVRQK